MSLSTEKPNIESKVNEVFKNLISRDEVKVLVKKSVSPDAELIEFHLRPFSQEKLGYLGSHLCLTVTAKQPGHTKHEIRNFFVKTLPYDVPAQANYVEEKGCFHKETKFFELVVPLMIDNFNGENWAPMCYLAKHNVMVFKDLKPKGYTNKNVKLLDEKSIEVALGSIARMHASSLISEERLQGKSLRDLYPEVFKESEFQREGRSYNVCMVGLNMAIDLANEMGLDTSKMKQASERIFDVYRSSKTKRNVVCHGDLWGSNLIFDNEDHCRLVDFQMVRYLPQAHDVMLLLYYGACTDVRRNHEKKLVKYYYKVFTDTLKLNNFNGKVPSFEDLLQGIEELRLPALFTAVLFHPIVLIDNQTITGIMCNPITCDAIFFGDRKSMVKKYMTQNLEYKQKIEGNIKEFVEMSLLIDSLPKYT